ncbi:MAG: FG-GAP repeat protein [Deltaproteobacteria bacterium]|nr:FG-GAP repeat protein [Deltaproteobacteria bacterium]
MAATYLNGNNSGDAFGATVASAGDVDANGLSDVIVGAWNYSVFESNESAAFIFRADSFLPGILSRSAAEAATRIESNEAGNGFISVGSAGDVNGDGYSDVVVGWPDYGGQETPERSWFSLEAHQGVPTPARHLST